MNTLSDISVEPPVYANLKNVTSQNKTEVVVDMDKTPTAKEPLTPNGTAIQVSVKVAYCKSPKFLDIQNIAVYRDVKPHSKKKIKKKKYCYTDPKLD